MRNHDLLDEAGMNALGPQLLPPMPRQKCSLHHGKVLEMYCGTHDFVYCTICIAVDHRSCTGIDYVPNAAKDIAKSQELLNVTACINVAERDLQMLHKGRKLDLRNIEEQKKKLSATIADYRKQLNKLMDDLETSTRNKLDISYKKFEDQINDDLSHLDNLLVTLRQKVKALTAVVANESQLFVDIKEAKQNANEFVLLLQNVEKSLSTESLDLTIDYDIYNYLRKITSFNRLYQKGSFQSATLIGQYDVKAKDDRGTCCCITGACYMPDGSIVIADGNKSNLKLLDQSCGFKSECAVSSGPTAVCRTGPTEVATSLYHDKKVQFASINDDFITLTKSFETEGKCTDVAYSDGEVYVACVGGKVHILGQIQVYDNVGTRLRTILDNSNNKLIFSMPSHISVGLYSTLLHVADAEKGIITLDTKGNLQKVYDVPELKTSVGVCVTDTGSIIACGRDSNNVILFDSTGQKQVELLSANDGIKEPMSVSYDRRNMRMLITMRHCNQIRVYDLI